MKRPLTLLMAVLVVVVIPSLSEARRSHHHNGQRHRSSRDFTRISTERDGYRGVYPRLRDMFQHIRSRDFDPMDIFDIWFNFDATRDDPWWEGPNVCENETETFVNKTTEPRRDIAQHYIARSHVCDESDSAYKCTVTQEDRSGRREVVVVYECCHGYTRFKGDFGCPTKASLKNLVAKAEELGLTDFLQVAERLNMTEILRQGNLTLFVPQNGAFGLDSDLFETGDGLLRENELMVKDDPSVLIVTETAVERALENIENAILGHVLSGAIRSSSMEDEEVFETANSEDSTIRINYYSKPQKLMTANCVPVVSRDHLATNGVIHTVEKVLKPVTKSLLDMVKSSPELSTLKTVLATANYVPTLKDGSQMTLLAPTNRAFDTMNGRLRERLLRGDQECLQKVLQNHILPNVICSEAIQGDARTPNLLRHYVNISRDENNKVFANDAQMVQLDVMATNGVMHVIDQVLVPDEALDIVDMLEKKGFTELVSLVKRAGLLKTLETASDITVFAPTNEAIENLPADVREELDSNPEYLAEVLKFHVSPGTEEYRLMGFDRLVPSLANTDIRLSSFSQHRFPFLTRERAAQCVPIQKSCIKACNGRIIVLAKMMLPPKGNVLDVLAMDRRFSRLVSLLKKSGLADDLQAEGPFTVFAPSNKAFESADSRTLQSILNNEQKLREFLKKHVVQGTLCCDGFTKRHRWNMGGRHTTALSGDFLDLSRDRNDTPLVDGIRVIGCDQTATNGNVLEVESALIDTRESAHDWGFWRWRHGRNGKGQRGRHGNGRRSRFGFDDFWNNF